MSSFKDILGEVLNDAEGKEAFILDHGKTVDGGALKYKDDATSYGWNTKRNNKLKKGSLVLNRHPGKITSDRKFEIYGGGCVESISEPDEEGNVTAVISHAFTIVPPIKQGESFIENFKWDSKNKKPGSWEHFWNQYGMNSISYTDYCKLLENRNCVELNSSMDAESSDLSEEEYEDIKADSSSGFKVTLEEDGLTHSNHERKYSGIARKIDFDKVQRSRNKTGSIGEEIVLDILTKEAIDNGYKTPVHASKDEGDGLGYDIRAWDADGNEIHIEVKTSTNNYSDGFEMSDNELKASQDTKFKYRIYRIYGLNAKTKECKLKVFECPFADDCYKVIPTKWVVYKV